MASLKKILKWPLYRVVDVLCSSSYVKEKLWCAGQDMFTQTHSPALARVGLPPIPAQYQTPHAPVPKISVNPAPIFITARFRSGSTFLWQLFRHIEGITCYYEPLNEAKWFLQSKSMARVDRTHIGVEDYRAEYEGMADLDGCFDRKWALHSLYMDETHHEPNMERYISELIARAKGRAALQFNRVDFRLPWLRAHFPEAVILHLYRHPREQWMSIIGKGVKVDLNDKIAPGDTACMDGFYTLAWARDLRHVFPFLEPANKHPYELHYLLWRLSYSFGRAYGNASVCYEDLITDFDKVASNMFLAAGVTNADISRLATLNHGKQKMRWPEYADDAWFSALEAKCDRELDIFFTPVNPIKIA